MSRPDPMGQIIGDALDAAGIEYECPRGGADFVLANGLVIECKQFWSARIADQMRPHPNIIAVQGIEAAQMLADLIREWRP